VSDPTGEYYRRHHSSGQRYGFTIAGDERAGWFRARIEELSQKLGKGQLDILDIGCRDGTLTSLYAKGHRVKGLDVDPDAVARANQLGSLEAKKHDLNLEPVPFPDASFDAVVAGEVLEHLQFPDNVVAEIRRVLRPGGVFIGSVPNAFRLRNRITFLMGKDFEIDPTHLHQFSPAAMKKLLGAFDDARLEFLGGRRRNLHPELMATQMHWIARR
jgi:SAM-dependent methyltransferase